MCHQVLFFFLFFGCTACGILVPWPGMEPMPPSLEAWSLDNWTVCVIILCHHIMKQFAGWFFCFNMVFLIIPHAHLLYLLNYSIAFYRYPNLFSFYYWWAGRHLSSQYFAITSSAAIMIIIHIRGLLWIMQLEMEILSRRLNASISLDIAIFFLGIVPIFSYP